MSCLTWDSRVPVTMSRFSTPLSRELRRAPGGVPLLLLLIISGVACSPDAHNERHALAVSHQIIADVVVTVANRTSREKRIYLTAGQARHALGTVTGRSSRSFSVPSSAGDSTTALRMEADDARGSRLNRSDIFHLVSGQRAIWTIDGGTRGVLTMR